LSKILLTGDWHIKASNPRNRIGQYKKQQWDKIEWILDLADRENCLCILQPGDLFDNRQMPEEIKTDYIYLFKRSKVPIFTVYGQHDMQYHKNKRNSAMAVLESADAIRVLSDVPIEVDDNVHVYGASWGEEIPDVVNKGNINILVIHTMVIEERLLWPGQKRFTKKNILMKGNNDYDIFCCGDNHNTFYDDNGRQQVFNLGSLMRSTIAQLAHEPTVAIHDIDNDSLELYKVPIEPAEIVFDVEKINKEADRADFTEFFNLLSSEAKDTGVDFETNVKMLSDKAKFTEEEQVIARNYISEYHQSKEERL
jgi:exonuclease SbcD